MKSKTLYMTELAQHIRKLPEADRRELLADYEEHFAAGLENGRTEEQICASLGSPKAVAQEIMMTTWAKKVDEAPAGLRSPGTLLNILLMILILAPFNFFMLLFPFLILFSLVITGWAIPISFGAATLALAGYFITFTGGESVGLLSGLSLIFMFVGGLGLSLLMAMIMWLLTKASFALLISFFKWNIDFITSRRTSAPVLNGGRV